jgi:hypothetical protein
MKGMNGIQARRPPRRGSRVWCSEVRVEPAGRRTRAESGTIAAHFSRKKTGLEPCRRWRKRYRLRSKFSFRVKTLVRQQRQRQAEPSRAKRLCPCPTPSGLTLLPRSVTRPTTAVTQQQTNRGIGPLHVTKFGKNGSGPLAKSADTGAHHPEFHSNHPCWQRKCAWRS